MRFVPQHILRGLLDRKAGYPSDEYLDSSAGAIIDTPSRQDNLWVRP
jgi:hypothetical protein